jgi:hypothetical protein
VDGALGWPSNERVLDTAMLVPQGNLEVVDVLAVALKSEVTGLDDPGMNGADGDLVNLVSLDAIEIHDTDNGDVAFWSFPRVVSFAPRTNEAHRFEPRMPVRRDAPLFRDVTLEQVDLWTFRRHRREAVTLEYGSGDFDESICIVREDDNERDSLALRRGSEKRRNPLVLGRSRDDETAKFVEPKLRDLIPCDRSAVAQ